MREVCAVRLSLHTLLARMRASAGTSGDAVPAAVAAAARGEVLLAELQDWFDLSATEDAEADVDAAHAAGARSPPP